jgi:hypothetical protein
LSEPADEAGDVVGATALPVGPGVELRLSEIADRPFVLIEMVEQGDCRADAVSGCVGGGVGESSPAGSAAGTSQDGPMPVRSNQGALMCWQSGGGFGDPGPESFYRFVARGQ